MESILNEECGRISWVDNLKALAIILVVLGHSGLEGQSSVYNALRTWIYSFHMPLFFLLSGLSFSIVFNRGKRSFIRQVCNVLIIYCIQTVGYVLLNISMHHFLHIQTQVSASFENLYTFLVYPVGHFWYLQALVIIYVMEGLLNYFIKDDKVKFFVVVLISIIGMNTKFGALSNSMYELLYFECGRQILSIKKTPLWITGIGLLVSFPVSLMTIDNTYMSRFATVMIALSVSVFLVTIFSKYADVDKGAITMVGRNCLWVYVFHTYFTSVTRNICNKIIPQYLEVSVVIVTLFGLIGPIVAMYVFKKIRIDRIVTKPISYLWK